MAKKRLCFCCICTNEFLFLSNHTFVWRKKIPKAVYNSPMGEGSLRKKYSQFST